MSIENVILNILSLPTAPFCESWVRTKCATFCAQQGIGSFQDAAGNLWVNAKDQAEVSKARVVFVAHMDHPGIAIRDFYGAPDGIYAQGTWFGGGPENVKDMPVTIFSNAEAALRIDGTIVWHSVEKDRPKNVKIKVNDPDNKWARLVSEADAFQPWGACLKFTALPNGVAIQGDRVESKSADDLISVAILLQAISEAKASGAVVLLTRDEEEGMEGTYAALKKHEVSPETRMISVEVTDHTFAQVTLGAGPVIRFGDAETVYDQQLTSMIQGLADQFKKGMTGFDIQVQGTSIGSTEATAFSKYGYKCSGLSLALENYHNKTPDFKVAPEAVSLSDVRNLAAFLTFLIKNLTTKQG